MCLHSLKPEELHLLRGKTDHPILTLSKNIFFPRSTLQKTLREDTQFL